jgi:hypothetical protein
MKPTRLPKTGKDPAFPVSRQHCSPARIALSPTTIPRLAASASSRAISATCGPKAGAAERTRRLREALRVVEIDRKRAREGEDRAQVDGLAERVAGAPGRADDRLGGRQGLARRVVG